MTQDVFFTTLNNLVLRGQQGKEKDRLNGFIRSRVTLLSCSVEGLPTSEFLYDAGDFELNPFDGVHGGFISTLFDVCIALTCCVYTDSTMTTTDIGVQYLRPLPKGKYRLVTEITHAGQTLVSAVGKMLAEGSDDICALCTVSYMKVQEGYKILTTPPDFT